MGAPGPKGGRQEHQHEVISFVGAGRSKQLFQRLHILSQVDNRRSTRGMSIRPQHATDVLEIRKGSKTKLFENDTWIRSLTEELEITTDVPEWSVTHDLQALEQKKVESTTMINWKITILVRICFLRRRFAVSERERPVLRKVQCAVCVCVCCQCLCVFLWRVYDEWVGCVCVVMLCVAVRCEVLLSGDVYEDLEYWVTYVMFCVLYICERVCYVTVLCVMSVACVSKCISECGCLWGYKVGRSRRNKDSTC